MNVVDDIFNFLRIDDTLSTSGQPTEAQIAALAETGCEVVVNLALHDDPRYSLPDETSTVESLGMRYIHIPVPFDAPDRRHLTAFFDAMADCRGRKVHVHCAANMRVTAFMGLYWLICEHKTRADAFQPMASIWEPDPVWSAFIDSMIDTMAG